MAEPEALDLMKAVLDPVRLAVLGGSVRRSIDMTEVAEQLGCDRGMVARAVGDLRAIGLLGSDASLDEEAMRTIARSLPGSSNGRGEPVEGPWSEHESRVLGRFFARGRLVEIPSSAAKRRLVIEKVALEFEPGRRYSEREVNFSIQLIHDDYAAVRRYLVDEGFMDRADGAYWRTGGRYSKPDEQGVVDEGNGGPIATDQESVTLRPYDWNMVDDLIAAADDARIPEYMGDVFPHPYTRDAAEAWLDIATASSPPFHYAIYVKSLFAGGVGAVPLDAENTGVAQIGWWLNPRFWGGGAATSAVKAFISEMFEHRDLERLWAPVMEPNVASARVAEKAGMRLEGVAPSQYVKRGSRMDALNFGITRSQWATS